MSDTDQIDGCAIVELMGHQTIAGHVLTSVLGSTVMLRVDVPARGEKLGFTRYYGMSAIYSLTLPMAKARGFPTYSREYPRGLVQARRNTVWLPHS